MQPSGNPESQHPEARCYQPGLSSALTSHHLEQLICRKFACPPATQSLDERASSARGFCGLKQPQLAAIRSRDEIYFRIGQQTETLAQLLRNGNLTFGSDFHTRIGM